MKIYTRTGDAGETSLLGGGRVPKDHVRIDAYGTLDELNAALGVARAEIARCERLEPATGEWLDSLLNEAQNRLFDLGAELAAPSPRHATATPVGEEQVAELESAIDAAEKQLPPLREFILPAGTPTAAQVHVARCVCRRAERCVVGLSHSDSVRELAVRYLNRLGDLLFVLARLANQAAGAHDTAWTKLSAAPIGGDGAG